MHNYNSEGNIVMNEMRGTIVSAFLNENKQKIA